MELILWRHAEAEDGPQDMARALTPKGLRQAEKMAAWLKTRLPKHTHVLVSPATRAQQTAAALGLDFTTLDALAPDASPETILEIAGWPEDTDSVLIVGHQPTLGAAAALALAQPQTCCNIRKGAVWWISNRPRNGTLETMLRAVIPPDLL